MLADELLGDAIELGGDDAGLGLLAEQRDRVGHELAGARHALDLLWALSDDQARTSCERLGSDPFAVRPPGTCSRAC